MVTRMFSRTWWILQAVTFRLRIQIKIDYTIMVPGYLFPEAGE